MNDTGVPFFGKSSCYSECSRRKYKLSSQLLVCSTTCTCILVDLERLLVSNEVYLLTKGEEFISRLLLLLVLL